MNLGLQKVLGVDTGKISLKDGKQKTSETVQVLQDFIQTTVNAMIMGTENWQETEQYDDTKYVLYNDRIYKSNINSNENNKPDDDDNAYWVQ